MPRKANYKKTCIQTVLMLHISTLYTQKINLERIYTNTCNASQHLEHLEHLAIAITPPPAGRQEISVEKESRTRVPTMIPPNQNQS